MRRAAEEAFPVSGLPSAKVTQLSALRQERCTAVDVHDMRQAPDVQMGCPSLVPHEEIANKQVLLKQAVSLGCHTIACALACLLGCHLQQSPQGWWLQPAVGR